MTARKDGQGGEQTSGCESRTPADKRYKDMENRFKELKKTILERAHAAGACKEQYGRAYKADSLDSLMQVVRDNFRWVTSNKVIDGELIDNYRDEFNAGKIWHNESKAEGFVLASGNATVRASDNATVRAYDNATVLASGNATVRAYNNATVEASNNATVRAYNNATVRAYDNATVEAYNNATVEASGNATVRDSDNATVRAYNNATVEASGNATVRASDNATVRAYNNAYIFSFSLKECRISDHAIYRITESNTIRYADPDMKFEPVKTPEE